jgi:hypothetical protein
LLGEHPYKNRQFLPTLLSTFCGLQRQAVFKGLKVLIKRKNQGGNVVDSGKNASKASAVGEPFGVCEKQAAHDFACPDFSD